MKLFDTHCHLDYYQSDELESILERAREKGVKKILTVGTNLESSLRCSKIADNKENIFFSAGCHPHEAKDFSPRFIRELKKLAKKKHCLAIGETGLDYYYLHSPKKVQKEVFRQHLELAAELDLPLIIHSRQALAEVVEMLSGFDSLSFVFHCFSGSFEDYLQIVEMGGYVSFAGIVTFKKTQELKKVAKKADNSKFFLETDAPYLSPEPYRGRKNEPGYLREILNFLAELRKEDKEELAAKTTENALRFFRLPN